MTNRYIDDDGEILISSVQGKGSLSPGSYHVLCERWDEVPEGVFAKFIVLSGPIKGAVQSCVIPKEALHDPLQSQNEYLLEIGISDGVVISRSASGYKMFVLPSKEILIGTPSPMSAIVAVLKANPSLAVAAPKIKRVSAYEKDIRISNTNKDHTEDPIAGHN